MNEELTAIIIKELGRNRNRREVIQRVRERGGLNWKQAEQFVILVEARHKRTIAARQTPWLLFFSIGTLLLGIGILAFNVQTLLTFLQQDVLGQVLGIQSSSYRMLGLLTGFGMTVGGLVGLWKSFGDIFPE